MADAARPHEALEPLGLTSATAYWSESRPAAPKGVRDERSTPAGEGLQSTLQTGVLAGVESCCVGTIHPSEIHLPTNHFKIAFVHSNKITFCGFTRQTNKKGNNQEVLSK